MNFESIIDAIIKAEQGYVDHPDILNTIQKVLSCVGTHFSTVHIAETTTPCSHIDCRFPAVSKGLCNTHYIRKRLSKNMDAPIRVHSTTKRCSLCNATTQGRGGWGMCAKHYKQYRSTIIKQTVVKLLGNKCAKCQQSYSLPVYDFHHTGDKYGNPSALIKNCHREEHHEL